MRRFVRSTLAIALTLVVVLPVAAQERAVEAQVGKSFSLVLVGLGLVVVCGSVLGSVFLTLMVMRRSIVAPLKHDIAALRDEVEQLRDQVERLQGRPSGIGPTDGIREL